METQVNNAKANKVAIDVAIAQLRSAIAMLSQSATFQSDVVGAMKATIYAQGIMETELANIRVANILAHPARA